MKCILEINSRVQLNESAESKHNRVIGELKKINSPWGVYTNDEIPFPGFKKEIFANVNLNKYMGNGIKCSIYYRYRNTLADDNMSDDRIYLEFNAKKNDYEDLATNILPKYIKLFDAYRAAIYSEELMFYDFERSRNVNFRNSIFRFYPVFFFDQTLSLRSLGISSEKVFNKLRDKVVSTRLLNNGILINSSKNLLSVDDANDFDMKVSSILR